MGGGPAAFGVEMAREVGVLYHSGGILQREHPRIELTLRYAPSFARVAWDDPVFDDTYRWCDAVRDRAMGRDAGWVSWAWYEDGAMVMCLRGADLERLWAAIEPVVAVLPVLEGSDAWIRQGVGPGMRNGPKSRKLWEK